MNPARPGRRDDPICLSWRVLLIIAAIAMAASAVAAVLMPAGDYEPDPERRL